MQAIQIDPATGQTHSIPISLPFAVPGPNDAPCYLSPPWIDSHVHIFDGIGFGLAPDAIGLRQGVHLLVDAGSAGALTLDAFRRFVATPAKERVMAFLNISATGLVTLREYADPRELRPEDAARAVRANPALLAGIKVRSSGTVLDGHGLGPLRAAVAASRLAERPVMIHMGEAPPENAENLALLRRGDLITHCFHGKKPPQWAGAPLWNTDGTPIPPLRDALTRGVLLDVGHGEASFSAAVARAVIARGDATFSISTDLHGHSFPSPVYSLAVTMSKFLALGMELAAVLRAVTDIPAQRLGLADWCAQPAKNGTLFRLRPRRPDDVPFVDAGREAIAVEEVIEPIAVVTDGEWLPAALV